MFRGVSWAFEAGRLAQKLICRACSGAEPKLALPKRGWAGRQEGSPIW